jgi:DNA-binding PadR family transcriptional regulator
MPLRHTLLGLLNYQPMHGYLLRQYAKEYSWMYPMTNASIYPALHGLEEDGFISHRSEIHSGRARKVYEITEEGRVELRRWLIDPSPQSLSFRDQTLLKVAMQSSETMAYARLWVEELIDSLRDSVSQHERDLKEADSMAHYTRLTMEYGVEMLRLRIEFLEKALIPPSD